MAKSALSRHREMIATLRTAVADYMHSEGCSCCRGKNHEKHAERLGWLLDVPMYEDGSGYNFAQFRTVPQKYPGE